MNVVTVYACQACGTLSGKPNQVCCAAPEPKPFVIDVEAEPQAVPFPDLVGDSGKAEQAKIVVEVPGAPEEIKTVEYMPVFKETFTAEEAESIRALINAPPKTHWWQRG